MSPLDIAGTARRSLAIDQQLVEKAMRMCCAAYQADVRARLLVSTLGEMKQSVVEARAEVSAQGVRVDSLRRERTRLGLLVDGRSAALRASNERLRREVADRERAQDELLRHDEELEQLVTERGREIERSQERLRHRERLAAVGTLAAGIAHEINNPVGAILLAAELAREDLKDQPRLEGTLDEIVQNARRCAEVVRSVLRFAREEPSDKEPGDFAELLRRFVEHWQKGAGQKGPSVDLLLDSRLPSVFMNASEMERVFRNLLENAAQAGARAIAIRVEKRDASLRITVEDDGHGIQEQDRLHLFDPFFSTRTRQGGTGLGLSITHGILLDHGASIDVESAPGHGTKIIILLPTVPEAAPSEPLH